MSTTTNTLGLTPFRTALAFEIFANMISLPSLLLNPSAGLAMLLSSPAQATPAARSLIQWLGGVVALLTVPLILSWPEPKSPTDAQAGFRRATYITMGAGEIILAGLLSVQYLNGEAESGLKGGMVGFLGANMLTVLAMRGVFLVWKREWLEGKGVGKKVE